MLFSIDFPFIKIKNMVIQMIFSRKIPNFV